MKLLRSERLKTIDTIEVYKVKPDGTLGNLILKTNNSPNLLQRLFMELGLYKCAGDAMMNWGIQQLALSVYNTYTHMSVGISTSSPSDYTLTDLVSPVMTRVVPTKSLATTYIADDTAQFLGVFTPDAIYTIVETGIHDALTVGHMGARQTSCSITTVPSESFAILWKVCIARG